MKQIKERLHVAFLLAVFMPVVLTVITNEEVGEWMMVRWTLVLGLLTVSYLMIETGSYQIIKGIDKLLGVMLLLIIGAFAVTFLLVVSSEVSDTFGLIRQKLLFASVFLMIAASMSLMVILFVKTAACWTEKIANTFYSH